MINNIKKYFFISCLLLTLSSCLFFAKNISAQDLSYKLSSTVIPVVEDKADLYSDYEEITIRDTFTKLRDETGYQFIFMTVTDTVEYVKGREVETMYNAGHGTLYGNGSVLFLISTDKDNLICEVQAYSYARDYLTFDVCAYINKCLRPYVEKGDYTGCINAFFDYYNQAYEGTLDTKNITAENNSTVMSFLTNNGAYLLITLLLSLAVTLIIFFVISRKFRTKTESSSPKPFIGENSLQHFLISDKETYIRSRISK